MANDLIETIVDRSSLPSLPTAALAVVQLVQSPDVEIDELAAAISNDPALTARLLRCANSTYYGQGGSVSTLNRAVMVLGLTTVRMLSLGFSLVQNLRANEPGGFDYIEFWQRSVMAGVGCRALAAMTGSTDPEESFVAGLLHRVGVLAMRQALGIEYDGVHVAAGHEWRSLIASQRANWKTDYAEVGGELATRWSLPPSLVESIRHHIDPSGAAAEFDIPARTLHLACLATEVACGEDVGPSFKGLLDRGREWFGLDQPAIERWVGETREQVGGMRQLFELPEGDEGTAAEILARAHLALAELTVASAQETARLERETVVLSAQANSDPLTRVANRRQMEGFLGQHLEYSEAHALPLSVLMLDLDHFKRINDEHGHDMGDRVLVEVAAVLRRALRTSDLVCRYGGEEFVVVLPDAALRAASFVAERLRRGIERIDLRGKEGKRIALTVSIGVSAFDPRRPQSMDQLIKDADNAMYEAKRAGRNQVQSAA